MLRHSGSTIYLIKDLEQGQVHLTRYEINISRQEVIVKELGFHNKNGLKGVDFYRKSVNLGSDAMQGFILRIFGESL